MKFTSIVLAALVAAIQFSSTMALLVATDKSANTTDGRPVTFDVIENDTTDSIDPLRLEGLGLAGTTKSSSYERNSGKLVLTESVDVEVPGTLTFTPRATGTAPVTFAPTPGFTGTTSFVYLISDMSGPNTIVTGTVTITVGNDIKLSFLIPKAVSNKDAIGLVRGGLFNAASFSPASPNSAALTALLEPVTDVDNFAAVTAPQAVTSTLNTLFTNFFGVFRGGV